jgi:DNA-binding response OmpR family regulator
MRLLLVEDDAMLGAGIRLGLIQDGFVVDWVQTRRAAEAALQSRSYGVVVLDPGLPREHGFLILQALHRQKHAIPVVVIGARDAGAQRSQALDQGGELLIKAFDLDELTARIRAALRRRGERAQRETATIALPFSWG